MCIRSLNQAYDSDFMEIGLLNSGSIDAYWVSDSVSDNTRDITPTDALATNFSQGMAVTHRSFLSQLVLKS